MIPIPIALLADIVGSEPVGFEPESEAQGFALDSRHVEVGDLFLAVRGAQVDGHEFVSQALRQGAVGSLVERDVEGPYLKVHNLVHALAQIGMHFRSQFHGPVVGITGSAGKTTTKEFVAAALSPLGPVLKTEGNRNTEYSSPLVWTELLPEHQSAVIEMGMRGFGHIAHLANISRPTIALITNIGYSHMELVGSQEGVAKAKGELIEALPENGTAILWHDDPFIELLKSKISSGRVLTFGFNPGANCRITGYEAEGWSQATVKGELDGEAWTAHIPAVGRHMCLNVAAAMLAAHEAGVGVDQAAAALVTAKLPPMRMEIREVGGVTVVLDAYNANPASMASAIETLAESKTSGRKVAVLGEMRELGEATEEGHREIGRVLVKHDIEEIVFLGEPMAFAREEWLAAGKAPVRARLVASLEDVTAFLETLSPGDTVLIKGSRALELERALKPLEAVSVR